MKGDYSIYIVHAIAWGSFGITRLILRGLDQADGGSGPVFRSSSPRTAPFSRALVAFHMVGFGVMYYGLGKAVTGGQVPRLFPFQRLAGASVILAGAALMCWALVYFRSWRLQAKIESGHELATGGPFGLMRHPIYAGINLLALGTALWLPSSIEIAAAFLLVLGSDLRARAEERLLSLGYGERYRAYMERTQRFIPGIY